MIQRHPLTEADFRGERFKDHGHDLKGNNDLLSITRPDVIKGIHRAYFKAGSDIVETNTFSTTTVSQADYGLEDAVREINLAGAGVAREAADEFMAANPGKRVFVAGSVGPTNRTASMSPDVNNPGYRAVTFDGLVVSYSEQIEALLDGGAAAGAHEQHELAVGDASEQTFEEVGAEEASTGVWICCCSRPSLTR